MNVGFINQNVSLKMGIIRNNILKYKERWFISIICIIGFALRLYRLTANDFWFDECRTFNRVFDKFSPEVFSYFIAVDKHPGLYYFSIKIWSLFFGFNDFSLRFFSVFWGTLAIILTYKLTRVFFSRQSALLSASIVAFSPFHIWYAQEARALTMSVTLGLLSLYFFLELLKNQSYKRWIGYFLSTTVLVFTSYYSLFLFIPQAVIILVFYRRVSFRWILVVSTVLFLFIPFSDLIKQTVFFHYNFWLSDSAYLNSALRNTPGNFILGYNGNTLAHIFVFVVSLIIFFCYFKKISKNKLVIFFLFILPILAVFFVSKIYRPIYIYRNLIICSPLLYIVFSEGILSIKQLFLRRSIVSLLGIIIAFSLVNYYNNKVSFKHMYPGVFLKKPVKPIVKLFLENKSKGDGIGFSNYGLRIVFRHYLPQLSKENNLFDSALYLYLPGADSYYEKIVTYPFMPGSIYINLSLDDMRKHRIKRLWLFSAAWDRQGGLGLNDQLVRKWFDERFPKEKQWYMDGVWIAIYNLTSSYHK